jgi:hypothetical protein
MPVPARSQHYPKEETTMPYTLVSGDNHIDLTYCPPDL